mmetsp:Transcript_147813/g.474487  ORF Transcript_147813/g.474487 Transcript_147813/m.474487 type:complete len:269 (-) Transcript_147813:124-930(-)|eukprot:CAMPEP_0203924896 /NCGR_PEP_ID=MMETSP0359-20131031/64618_1 /ASSEMBLY_ACC=CAM_ASM_000338 /TAXON_ID=268821 /ORGANISM="Scrippsiella Hangoei, Strain SHTV-5" /LENGTH=268 /DNA_ID=CAMNT_0050853209 /DNA_START=86 /DNA_END=892 /DNA_ORIENTATION=+
MMMLEEDGEFSESSNAVPKFVRPLEPPQRNALGLDWMEREPPEFAQQRYQEARRKASKLMMSAYREAFQRLGVGGREPPPWPPRDDAEDDAEARGKHHDFRKVYRQQPVVIPAAALKSSSSLPALVRKSGDSDSEWHQKTSCSGASSAPRRGGTKEKDTMSNLWEFGRGAQGTPYTYTQIFEEIEANVRHRASRDSRASTGRLGPAVLGPGATRAPRTLPKLRRAVHSSGMSFSAGTEPTHSLPLSPESSFASRQAGAALVQQMRRTR